MTANLNVAVSLELTKAFMRATLFSKVSHGCATIMRLWLCYSFNPRAEQNASDIIGVEWQLFI